MSAVVVAVAIGTAAALGAVAFVTLARRSDVRGVGALSRETRRRDRAGHTTADLPAATASAVEAQGVLARRGDVPAAVGETVPPTPWVRADQETVGLSRRMFLNRASVTLTSTGIGAFAAAGFVAFLWPTRTGGGFGQQIVVGNVADVMSGIAAGGGFLYVPEARAWITRYPADALPKAAAVYDEPLLPGYAAGIVALYQKCPHLGCRVPQCLTSQWFECPCHGSQYNRVGEKKAGPAPRGMDRFPVIIAPDGGITVDTSTVITGPAIGTNTTGQEAEGPHCVSAGAGEH